MISTVKNVLFIILAVLLILSLSKNIIDYQKKTQFFMLYQQELASQKEKNKELQSQIVKSQDPYTKEQQIRNNLNLLKKDEIMVILPITPVPKTPQESPKENYQKWLELFQ